MAPISLQAKITEHARHARGVALVKKMLWIAATLSVASVVWLTLMSTQDGARIVFSNVQKAVDPMPPKMLRPIYRGVDQDNEPFTISAESAMQQDDDTVLLQAITADITLKDTSWLALTAGRGIYTVKQKHLELSGFVNMFYEGGYEFRTEQALVDLGAGKAKGDHPVEGQSPSGTLRSDAFRAHDRGKRLEFIGNVHTVLYP